MNQTEASERPFCVVCGTQYPTARETCPICLDERQWVRWEGQAWITREELAARSRNVFRQEEAGVWGIGTEPQFAIGQRALLLCRPEGNVLWDCISHVDEATVARVRELGGVSLIAISHPHFFSGMMEWSEALGGVPILLHESLRRHVAWDDERIQYWAGERRELGNGMTLVRVGGHFAGSTVLHWAAAAEGRGALFPGDSIRVAQDREQLAFMYSYVNFIPLSAAKVRALWEAMAGFEFERIYGYWFDYNVLTGAKEKLRRSVERYVAALEDSEI